MKINLGCGPFKKPGFVNCDYDNTYDPDMVFDADKGLPFKDNSVDYFYAGWSFEHLGNIANLMSEIRRVCKNGAIVDIYTTHFSCHRAQSELHKSWYRYLSFTDWVNKGGGHMSMGNHFLDIIEKKIIFHKGKMLYNYLIEPFANKFPLLYEGTFLVSMFPAWDVHYKYKVVKK